MNAERFAVYWAPETGHPLWLAGCAWLGRDAAATTGGGQAPAGRPYRDAPARYGFHATLKAPFRLRDGATLDELRRATAELAARHADFEMPALEVGWLHDFLALRPVSALPSSHPLRRLADDCVGELDRFRAAATPAEQARHAAGAEGDAERQALLQQWGYPHVFDAWRLHMTLSDRFADRQTDSARRLEGYARGWFANSLTAPLRCAALSIFHEAAPGQPFRLLERLPLVGGTRR